MRRALVWSILLCVLLLAGCNLFRPPGPELLYQERFTQAEGNTWFVGENESRRFWIAGGKYHLECQPDSSGGSQNPSAGQYEDFELRADVEHISGINDKSAAGVIFRLTNWDNYYQFWVSPAGTFHVRKVVAGEFITIEGWTSHDAITVGTGVNKVAVVADGSSLVFRVNGQEVFRTTDTAHVGGNIGVRGNSWSDNTMHVTFDNVEVWSLP